MVARRTAGLAWRFKSRDVAATAVRVAARTPDAKLVDEICTDVADVLVFAGLYQPVRMDAHGGHLRVADDVWWF
jgi:hypothetical protein